MFRWISIACVVLAIGVFAVFQNPLLKEKIFSRLHNNDVKVLAVVYGSLTGDVRKQKVVKIQTGNKIYLEIYDATESANSPNRLQKILLPDALDAQIDFRGNLTRLIIADINQDGQADIIAPTIDGQMTPHLNAYTYNKDLESFELLPQTKPNP